MADNYPDSQTLLDVVKKMPPEEFDAFLESALSVRQRPSVTLSAKETKLLKRINRGLSAAFQRQYSELIGRRKRRHLTEQEHQKLLKLTDQAETQDADRAEALLELAKQRRVPIRILMKQLGIRTPAVHG